MKVAFTLRVGLTSSVKPLWKNPYTRSQTYVSTVTPNLLKLAVKVNHRCFPMELILSVFFITQKRLPWQMVEWVFKTFGPSTSEVGMLGRAAVLSVLQYVVCALCSVSEHPCFFHRQDTGG